MNECRAFVEWYWQETTKELGDKTVSVSLCPSKIPDRLTWDWTRVSVVNTPGDETPEPWHGLQARILSELPTWNYRDEPMRFRNEGRYRKPNIYIINLYCRSQWPRGLRRGYTAVRLLGLWVRITPEAWMSVFCECCVLSGRGLCDGLVPRPEESYRVWCV
jgi:hypothetical protein